MIFYVVVLSVLAILFWVGRSYTNTFLERLDRKQYRLYKVMYVVAYWLNKFKFFQHEKVQRKLQEYQMLFPGVNVKGRFYLQWYHRFSIMYILVLVLSILCLLLNCSSQIIQTNEFKIQRPSIGSSSKMEKVTVMLEEDSESVIEEIELNIQSRVYTPEEVMQYKKEAEEYVLAHMKGENTSLSEVYGSLNLMSSVPNNPFKVSWMLFGQSLINEDGTIHNKELEEKEEIVIKVCLSFEEEETYMEIPIGVMPYQWSWEERAKEEFLELVSQVDTENKTSEGYQLPDHIGTIDITYLIESEDKSIKLLLCMMIGIFILWIYWDEQQKGKSKKRVQECQLLYPDMVYKLTLLIGAGMTLKSAWKRLVEDYLKEKKKSGVFWYIYEEMLVTWNEMESGIAEVEAIERFGKRMKIRSYLRLSSIVSQNMKKGTKGFLQQLEVEAKEAQEERKQMAKKLGEEAGTKLLFPMLIMLVIVFVIVMMPAFLSFSKGGL